MHAKGASELLCAFRAERDAPLLDARDGRLRDAARFGERRLGHVLKLASDAHGVAWRERHAGARGDVPSSLACSSGSTPGFR